jgi:dihydropyrimidinase
METGSVLIRGGRMVVGRTVTEGDLLIKGERIESVGNLPDAVAPLVVDATGLLVLPGGIDTHVHFNDVFMGR